MTCAFVYTLTPCRPYTIHGVTHDLARISDAGPVMRCGTVVAGNTV